MDTRWEARKLRLAKRIQDYVTNVAEERNIAGTDIAKHIADSAFNSYKSAERFVSKVINGGVKVLPAFQI